MRSGPGAPARPPWAAFAVGAGAAALACSGTWQCSQRTPSAPVNPRMTAVRSLREMSFGRTFRFSNFSGMFCADSRAGTSMGRAHARRLLIGTHPGTGVVGAGLKIRAKGRARDRDRVRSFANADAASGVSRTRARATRELLHLLGHALAARISLQGLRNGRPRLVVRVRIADARRRA